MIRFAPFRARECGFCRRAARLVLTSLLNVLLTFHGLLAQTHGADVQAAASPKLFITILEGEGALNNIRARTAREPIVQVEDENHKPLAEVSVVFLLRPGETGANGTFGAQSAYRTVTDANGRAVGLGLQPNNKSGAFVILVIATLGALTAEALIHQTNTPDGLPLPAAEQGVGFPNPGSGAAGSTLGRTAASGAKSGAAPMGTARTVATWLAGLGGAAAASLGIVEIFDSGGSKGSGGSGGSNPTVPVPEIDPSLGLSCLLLLAGVFTVLRER